MTEIAHGESHLPQARKGSEQKNQRGEESRRLVVFLHALAFVFGFTAVFTLIGSAAGLLGQNLNFYLRPIQQIGAVMLVIFALITLGGFRWLANRLRTTIDLPQNPAATALVSFLEFFNALLYTERRVTEMHKVNRNWGYLSSALLGVSFSAGWVPCVGPILASIFFLAQDSAMLGLSVSSAVSFSCMWPIFCGVIASRC